MALSPLPTLAPTAPAPGNQFFAYVIHFDDFRFYCNSDQVTIAREAYISHLHFMAKIMALRILTWIFPWLMAVFELLLRLSLHEPNATGFIGPTIGGASLGMLLTLTRARELGGHSHEEEDRVSFDRGDDQMAQVATLALWTGFTAWACSLYLSLGDIGDVLAGLDPERTSNLIGFILWSTVIVFDVVRGGVR